jgi:hypothetical protein
VSPRLRLGTLERGGRRFAAFDRVLACPAVTVVRPGQASWPAGAAEGKHCSTAERLGAGPFLGEALIADGVHLAGRADHVTDVPEPFATDQELHVENGNAHKASTGELKAGNIKRRKRAPQQTTPGACQGGTRQRAPQPPAINNSPNWQTPQRTVSASTPWFSGQRWFERRSIRRAQGHAVTAVFLCLGEVPAPPHEHRLAAERFSSFVVDEPVADTVGSYGTHHIPGPDGVASNRRDLRRLATATGLDDQVNATSRPSATQSNTLTNRRRRHSLSPTYNDAVSTVLAGTRRSTKRHDRHR